jgi:hypothetical protein
MAFTQIFQDGLNAFLLVVAEHNARRNWGLGGIEAHMAQRLLQQRTLHQVSPWESQPRDTPYELHADVVMVSVSLKLKSECKQCKHAYR